LSFIPLMIDVSFAPLFPGKELSNLTAVTIAHRTKCNIFDWNDEMADEREELANYFSEAAKEMCTYLNNHGYWADYIDPYTCHGTTSDALTETDARLKRLGFLIDDIACCKILRHQRWGHQVSVGVVFTNAPPSLPMLVNLQTSSLSTH
uniref:Methylmalonic aciduria and homocystinuria type D homolog n=1 Tax=Schistocephalus solidus TaxID=70667 RepID=A0A183S9D1_SCHSO